jgi:hypothetical protein
MAWNVGGKWRSVMPESLETLAMSEGLCAPATVWAANAAISTLRMIAVPAFGSRSA